MNTHQQQHTHQLVTNYHVIKEYELPIDYMDSHTVDQYVATVHVRMVHARVAGMPDVKAMTLADLGGVLWVQLNPPFRPK